MTTELLAKERPDPAATRHELSVATIDDLIARTRVEIPPLTPEVLQALSELDSLEMYRTEEAVNIVGVFSGIKPVALLKRLDSKATIERLGTKFVPVMAVLPDIVRRMGLVYEEVNAQVIALSRHQELIDAIKPILPKLNVGYNDVDRESEYRVGKLLGFPESAISYYIERVEHYKTSGHYLPVPDSRGFEYGTPMDSHFRQYVSSPDKVDEEVQQYSGPLRRATEVMTPKIYARILDKKT